MKKMKFENPVCVSLGVVMNVKRCPRNELVKYQIAYRDDNGRDRMQWSDWMRDDGYEIGDSIPVKALILPMMSMLLEVDNTPQSHVDLYSAAIVGMGMFALIAGYFIGKERNR